MLQQQIDSPVELSYGAMQPALLGLDEIGFESGDRLLHGRSLRPASPMALIDILHPNIDQIDATPHAPGRMNIHHLELFYYVARAGGITASLSLIPYGIQQPAVSAQLTRLEEDLGTRLFHRRPFSLTSAGREVFDHIAPFFGSLSRIAGSVRNEAAQNLRLAASASVLREHLPGLLKRMTEAQPALRISLREASQATAERMLREHEIDLAVVLIETKPGSGITAESLAKVPLTLLVPADAPYRSAADLLRATKTEPPPLVSVPAREQLSVVFQKELARRGLAWPTRIEASSLDLVEAYVGHGFGVGLSLDIPGMQPGAAVRRLPLRGFPRLNFGALRAGRLAAPAANFLDLARTLARKLTTTTTAR